MTDLERMRAYWPIYRECLSSATSIDEAEFLLRKHHGMLPGAFQDFLAKVRLLGRDEQNNKSPATIIS